MSSRLSLRVLLARCFQHGVGGNRCRFRFTRGKLRTLRVLLTVPSFSIVLDSVGVPRVSKLALLAGVGRVHGPTLGYVVMSTCNSVRGVHDTVGRKTFSFAAGPVGLRSLRQAVRGTTRRVTFVGRTRERRARLRSVRGSLRITRRVRRAVLPGAFPPFPRLGSFSLCTCVGTTGCMKKSFCSFFHVSRSHLNFIVTSISNGNIPTTVFVTVDQAIVHTVTLARGSTSVYVRHSGGVLYRRDMGSVFIAMFCNVLGVRANAIACDGTKRGPPVLVGGSNSISGMPSANSVVLKTVGSTDCRRGRLGVSPNSGLFLCASKMARTVGAGRRLCDRRQLLRGYQALTKGGPGRIIRGVARAINRFIINTIRSSSVALLSVDCGK